MARRLSSSRSRLAPAIMGLALLGGCSLGKIDFRQVNSAYDANQYQWIPYTKGMHADISGNPFAMPQTDFNAQVSKTIQAEGFVPVSTGPRVRLVFNHAAPDGNYICESSGDTGNGANGNANPPVGRDSGGKISISAAYCSGSDVLTYATGSITDVTSPDDPQFRSFLRNMVVYLFPSPVTPGLSNACVGSLGC